MHDTQVEKHNGPPSYSCSPAISSLRCGWTLPLSIPSLSRNSPHALGDALMQFHVCRRHRLELRKQGCEAPKPVWPHVRAPEAGVLTEYFFKGETAPCEKRDPQEQEGKEGSLPCIGAYISQLFQVRFHVMSTLLLLGAQPGPG